MSSTPGELGLSSKVTGSPGCLVGDPGGPGSSSRVTDDTMRSAASNMPVINKNSYTIASDDIKSVVECGMAKLDIKKWQGSLWRMHQYFTKVNDDGAEFLVNNSLDYDIYIRPSYMDIYELFDEKFRGTKSDIRTYGTSAASLTGTPGIGKTVFGIVLAKMVVNRQKPALVFYSSKSENIELFWQGQTFRISESDAISLVCHIAQRRDLFSTLSNDQDQLEIWSIGDSRFPITVGGIIKVHIASPGAQTSTDVKHWVKSAVAMRLVLPPCEWDEICHIRTALYRKTAESSCPLGELWKRFNMWGGVPRSIISDPELLDQCHSKFVALRIRDAIPYLGTSSLDHNRQLGSIFHLFPAFRLDQRKQISKKKLYSHAYAAYWWATNLLENKAWSQFRNEREADVLDFIETLNNDASIRGKFWEQEIHQLIEHTGIQGTLRELETGNITKNFKVAKSSTSFFKMLTDINPSSDYWRPESKIHKTCNSYKPSMGAMFQMTVGKSHEINISGLEEILRSKVFDSWRKEHRNECLKLIFIVHKSVYQEFGKQHYRFTSPDAEENCKAAQAKKPRNTIKLKESRKRSIESKIRQYVLEIDVEELLKNYRIGTKARGKRMVEDGGDDGDDEEVDIFYTKKRKV